jgi:hypothetical protein
MSTLIPLLSQCLDQLGRENANGICNPDGWAITVAVEANDMREAWIGAMSGLFSAAVDSGLPLWRAISVTVVDGEYAAFVESMAGDCI